MDPVDISSNTLPPFAPPSVGTVSGGGLVEGIGEGVTAVKEDGLLEVTAGEGKVEE